MTQKLPVNGFEWVEETLEIIECFVISYNEESEKGYFLEGDLQYTKKLYDLQNNFS